MNVLLAICLLLLGVLNWGAWSRLHDLEMKVFELEHPEFFKDEGLMAEYLGNADD